MSNTVPTTIPTGQEHPRVDGRLKVTGRARYAAEFPLPGLTHAALVQSTIPAGRLVELDTAAAERAPGVVGILSARNMPRLAPPPDDLVGKGQPGEPYVPLQDDRIHWAGQHLALVVAETSEQARYAAGLVRAKYEEDAHPALRLEDALGQATEPELWAGREKLQTRRGDAPAALAKAETVTRATYETPVENHNPIELVCTTAHWETPTQLVVHDTTRGIKMIQRVLANAFSLAVEDVRVLAPFVGGAFGSKGFQWQHLMIVAAAARMAGRPVRLEFTREQMFTTAGRRARTVQNFALGATHQGFLNALTHETLTTSSPVVDYTEPAGNLSRNLYTIPNTEVTHRLATVHEPSPCPMRAPGEAPGSYALECAMDELACALPLDPLELRLRNHADADEYERKPYSSKHLKECYQQGAEAFGWANRTPEPRSMRTADGKLLVGWGMSTAAYPAKQMPAAVRVTLHADGTATGRSATHELGTGTYTCMSQLLAGALGLPVEKVRFELGDSKMPLAPVNGGSWLTSSVGPALLAACAALKKRLLETAVATPGLPMFNAKPNDLVFTDDALTAKFDPNCTADFTAILNAARLPLIEAEANAKPTEEDEKFATVSFGAHFAEVTVDPDLGEVRLRRYVGVFDPGRVINPQIARSQMYSGITFGLGMAFLEASEPDPRTGRTVNANLAEYHVPTCADFPAGALEIRFVNAPDPHFGGELGARGLGELGIVGCAAALANAVYHATGKRVRDLPITPDKLL